MKRFIILASASLLLGGCTTVIAPQALRDHAADSATAGTETDKLADYFSAEYVEPAIATEQEEERARFEAARDETLAEFRQGKKTEAQVGELIYRGTVKRDATLKSIAENRRSHINALRESAGTHKATAENLNDLADRVEKAQR